MTTRDGRADGGVDGGRGDEPIGIDVVASGALAERLPPGGERRGRARVDMPPDSSVADLLRVLGLVPEQPLLVILDGAVVPPDARAARRLNDGDALSLAPPIRAG